MVIVWVWKRTRLQPGSTHWLNILTTVHYHIRLKKLHSQYSGSIKISCLEPVMDWDLCIYEHIMQKNLLGLVFTLPKRKKEKEECYFSWLLLEGSILTTRGSSKSPVAPGETGEGAVRASTCTFSANAFSKDAFATLVTHVMRIAAQ